METITVTPNGFRVIPDSPEQVTFFNLTHEGRTYKWHGNTPRLVDEDLETYLTTHREEYLSGIYRKMYLGARIVPDVGETELDSWTRWIAGGCKNTREAATQVDGESVTSTLEEVIASTPWKDSHPINDTPVTWV